MNVSVPGKAFLCGEFVAVDAAPAVVAAISRRVEATFSEKTTVNWRIDSSPGGVVHRPIEDLLTADPVNDLVAAVVQSITEAERSLPDRLSVALDSSAMMGANGGPIGLGSSAAGAVALVAGLSGSPAACEAIATDAHRAFQGGFGSGYDVACCCRGGVQVIRRNRDGSFAAQPGPEGMELEVILALGETALSTAAVLQIVDRYHIDTADVLAALAVTAADFSQAFLQGAVDHIIAAAHRFFELEVELGGRIGIDVVPDSVQQLSTLLGPLQTACKPSGAGGDGLVVVFAPLERAVEAREVVEHAGFQVLTAEIGAPGVEIVG